MIFNYLYFFILGALFGSFFNVVGLRIPLGKSIIVPRSSCSKCGHTLQALELIPIFSFIFQNGKCRMCGKNISKMYFLIELLTGFLFAFTFYKIGFQKEIIVGLSIVSLLVIILVTDLAYMLIPNRILLFFLPIFILERFYIPLDSWWSSIIGSLAAFFFLFMIGIISDGGMGGGDIKLFGVLGVALGWKLILMTFIIACFMGTIWGLIAMKVNKSKNSNPFPFGPCIAIGCIASYFYSEELMHWYFFLLS